MQQMKCPISRQCNACQLQNMNYEEQLAFKQRKARRHLEKFCEISPIMGMDFPYHYRNKAQFTFRKIKGGAIIAGIYQSKTQGIASTETCMLNPPAADAIAKTLCKLLKSFKISIYDPRSQAGYFRHVLIRSGQYSGEIMVVLVTTGTAFPKKTSFINALLREHPEISTVVLNVSHSDKMMLGEEEEVVFGKGYIEDTLCSKSFKISPRSFFQVNSIQTEKLYNAAIQGAALTGEEMVIDAYCGTGTISIIASDFVKSAVGVELVDSAVRDAVYNAEKNKVENCRFIRADAGSFMNGFSRENKKADAVFLDPPRAGCSRKFLLSLIGLAPKKIIYISCNVQTQERDLTFLTKRGYIATAIQPVDMFPHTNHVETCVLLSHKNS